MLEALSVHVTQVVCVVQVASALACSCFSMVGKTASQYLTVVLVEVEARLPLCACTWLMLPQMSIAISDAKGIKKELIFIIIMMINKVKEMICLVEVKMLGSSHRWSVLAGIGAAAGSVNFHNQVDGFASSEVCDPDFGFFAASAGDRVKVSRFSAIYFPQKTEFTLV